MTDRLVRLVWKVCPSGYQIEKRWHPPGGPSKYGAGVKDCIVPRTSEVRRYEAHLLEHEIFRHLANSARRPGSAGVLEFIDKWGLLGPNRDMESMERFLELRDLFVEFISKPSGRVLLNLRLLGRLGRFDLGDVHLRIEIKRGRVRYFLETRSLLQFCVLEFLHAVDGNFDLTSCEACGELLPVHKRGRPKRYCDDACKMSAWRAKYRDAINRERRKKRRARRSAISTK
jgi:hypothetical protein